MKPWKRRVTVRLSAALTASRCVLWCIISELIRQRRCVISSAERNIVAAVDDMLDLVPHIIHGAAVALSAVMLALTILSFKCRCIFIIT